MQPHTIYIYICIYMLTRLARISSGRSKAHRISGGPGPTEARDGGRGLQCDLVNAVLKNEEESAPHSLIVYTECLTHLLGPSHGCIRQREDLNALAHLVRSARSLDARHEYCLVEQINRGTF